MSFVTSGESGQAAESVTGSPSPPVQSAPGLPMAGMEHAKTVLGNYLASYLPAYCDAMRSIIEVPAASRLQNLLPTPDKILTFEPPALDAGNLATATSQGATSLLYVSCMSLSGFRMVGFDERTGDPSWRSSYPMTVITWVKGQLWQDTIAASNNLMTAVRACLMAKMGLDDADYVRLDPNTYREQASEPEMMGGNRHVRAAGASFTMILRETLDLTPIAKVANPKLAATILASFSTLPDRAIDAGLSTIP